MAAPIADITELAEVAMLGGPNMLVPWYLIASYAYYILDEPILPDDVYDRICHELYDALDKFEIDHLHMHLCDMEALKAGSCYHLKAGDYPSRARSAAERFASGKLDF